MRWGRGGLKHWKRGEKSLSRARPICIFVLHFGGAYLNLKKRITMKTVTAGKANSSLSKLLRETAASHEPIHIIGEPSNGVLISDDDWRAIQETLYLLSIPKMRKSLVEGMKTPLSECSRELRW